MLVVKATSPEENFLNCLKIKHCGGVPNAKNLWCLFLSWQSQYGPTGNATLHSMD